MNNEIKEFIIELLNFIAEICPSYKANRMFQLTEKAKELGIY